MTPLQREYFERRRLEIERQREAELITEAEHARDGIKPKGTMPAPVFQPPIPDPAPQARRIERIPQPRPKYQPPAVTSPRHPNSVISVLAQQWREGKL